MPEVNGTDIISDRVTFGVPDWNSMREQGLLFADMHFHTNCSDSFTSPELAIKMAHLKHSGFAVTDHNLVRNVRPILEMKDETDFVIPGMEISSWDGPHILTYFYSADDLVSYWERNVRPYMSPNPWLAIKRDTRQILESLEDENCLVSAAHPMGYFSGSKGVEKAIRKNILTDDICELLDAYEVICSGMSHKNNLEAVQNAQRHGLAITGGTDGHLHYELGNVVSVCEADDIEGFFKCIKDRKNLVIGTEKNAPQKVAMGTAAFFRFMPHVPASLFVHYQTMIGKNSNIRRKIRQGP